MTTRKPSTRWMVGGLCLVLAAGVAGGCSADRAKERYAVVQSAVTHNGCSPSPLDDGRVWCATDVKTASAPASFDYTPGGTPASRVFTVTSAAAMRGPGDDNDGNPSPDEMRFVHTTITGDIELVARLKAFQGQAGDNVGVTIRADTSARPAAGVGMLEIFGCGGCSPKGHEFIMLSRPAADARSARGRMATDAIPQETPPPAGQAWSLPAPQPEREVWFRVQRVGKDFSVARSQNGTTWIPLANASGGELASSQVVVGFFVSRGDSTNPTASATFDNVYVGAVRGHKTSWVGGNLSQVSTDTVHGSTNGFYVDGQGRAYTVSKAAELGHEIDVLQNGMPVKLKSHWIGDPADAFQVGGVDQGGVGGDPFSPSYADYVYYGYSEVRAGVPRSCIGRRRWNAAKDTLEPNPALVNGCPAALGSIAGFAVRNGEIYVSDLGTDLASSTDDKIKVLDANTLVEIRNFSVQRPSAIAVDHNAKLWIIQSATDYPRHDSNYYELKHPPAIVCYTAAGVPCLNGNGTPRQIVDASINNPVALAIDPRPTADRLLIADNGGGSNNDGAGGQNIRIFTSLNSTPVAQPAFGAAGGLYSGARGAVFDAASGGNARFYNLIGVGMDLAGNIYVASGGGRIDVRSFNLATGSFNWAVYGTTDPLDFDPGSDDIYSATERFVFDPARTLPGPGSNLTGFKSVTWDPFKYAEKDKGKVGRKSGWPIVRRFNGNQRFMYVLGDSPDPPGPDGGPRRSAGFQRLSIYRFDAQNMAVPCGVLSLETVCHKPSGDQCGNQPMSQCLCNIEPAGEVNSIDEMLVGSFWADANGNGIKDPGDSTTEWSTVDPFSRDPVTQAWNVPESAQAEPTQAERNNPRPPAKIQTFDVDSDGDIWLPLASKIWQLKRQGMAGSCPLYRGNHDPTNPATRAASPRAIHDLPKGWSGEADFKEGNRVLYDMRFDRATSALYMLSLVTQANPLPSGATPLRPAGFVSRFDWDAATGKGDCASPGECYEKRLGDPRHPKAAGALCPCKGCQVDTAGSCAADVNCRCKGPAPCPELASASYATDFMMGTDDPTNCTDADGNHTWEGYHGLDLAGDKLFLHEVSGPVRVLQANTGLEVARLSIGPESSGSSADSAGWIRMNAHRRGNGEYLVIVSDDMQYGRSLLYRWTPGPTLGVPGDDCTQPSQCASGFCETGVCCETSCTGAVCQDASCNGPIPGQCWRTNWQNGTTCNDSNACTTVDSCQDGACIGTRPGRGSENFCSATCRCASGDGDCDSAAQCQSGLNCVAHVGASFGMSASTDVCVNWDPTCSTGFPSSNVCCAASCGACGGSGCASRPGGGNACCLTNIRNAGVSCTTSGPPCVLSDPQCKTGIRSGSVCCAYSCGTCGGTGCSGRPGGSAACCSGTIQAAGRSCAEHMPPCTMP